MQRTKRKVRMRAKLVFVLFRVRVCLGHVMVELICMALVVIDRDNSI